MSEAFEGRAGGMAAYQELAEALEERYFAILRVEPEADQVLVLQSVDNPEHMGKTLSWTAHLERYGAFLAEPAREKTMRRLSARALLESCRRGERGISLSLDYVRGGRTNWVTVVTRNRVQKDGRFRCFVFVRQTNEEHLRQRIIDLYVYNTCDFFICLDARNNSYVMFSGSESGTPLPPEICDWSVKTGHRCEGSGSYHSLIPDGAAHYNVPCRGIGQSGTELVKALQDGKLVIAIMSAGHFTRGGHFIVLRGITDDGKILVADCASYERSQQEWDLGIFLAECNKGAAAGGPFWVLG